MSESQSWIKQIEPELLEVAGLAQSSTHFSFPVDEFTQQLGELLKIKHLKASVSTPEWKTRENFLSGLGNSPVSFSIQLTPLVGTAFIVIAFEDVAKLTSWIKDENDHKYELENPELIKGVYRYIFLEALNLANKTTAFGDLSPKLTEGAKFDNTSFSLDVSLKNGQSSIWFRVIISPALKQSCEDHLRTKKSSLADVQNIPDLMIPLSLQNGAVELEQDELNNLQEGDVVVVDNMHYRPAEEKGSLKMAVGETPVFQVKLKDGKLKILDYIYSYEEGNQ